eukprot:4752707-Prymnesium_polylepis.1
MAWRWSVARAGAVCVRVWEFAVRLVRFDVCWCVRVLCGGACLCVTRSVVSRHGRPVRCDKED